MSSTPCERSSAINWRSKTSRSMPFDAIAFAVRPRLRANSKPGASGWLESTTAISASRLPCPMESAMARKFDPRPEIKMPRRFMQGTPSGTGHRLLWPVFVQPERQATETDRLPHCPLFVHNPTPACHFSDLVEGLAQRTENPRRILHLARRNHHDHPDSQIKCTPPVEFRNTPDLPQQLKHRQHRPGSHFNPHAQPLRQNPRSVLGDAAAGDMRRALDQSRLVHRAQRSQIAAMNLQ